MIGKLICASMLVSSSVPVFAQDASRRASADMFLKFPFAHQCTVTPGADWGATTGRSGTDAAWSRIDLQFTVSPPSAGGTVPTVSGFAINTKGTGANSGRLSAKPAGTATVGCTGTALATDDAAQKAALQDISFMSRSSRQGAGWSCSVSGPDDAPQFVLGLLVPPILGQAERTRGPSKGAGRSEWSWGMSNSSGQRVSIVPRGSNVAGSSPIACSSDGKPIHHWDLAVAKK